MWCNERFCHPVQEAAKSKNEGIKSQYEVQSICKMFPLSITISLQNILPTAKRRMLNTHLWPFKCLRQYHKLFFFCWKHHIKVFCDTTSLFSNAKPKMISKLKWNSCQNTRWTTPTAYFHINAWIICCFVISEKEYWPCSWKRSLI